jgi:hypothetical protein
MVLGTEVKPIAGIAIANAGRVCMHVSKMRRVPRRGRTLSLPSIVMPPRPPLPYPQPPPSLSPNRPPPELPNGIPPGASRPSFVRHRTG